MADLFKGRAKRLDDIDLPRIGHRIGVGEDEIHAVLDVEAAGSGFDDEGRVKALYEPHIAYREANKRTDKTALNKLVKAGLAYPKWGQKSYPKDSYPRILAAMEIDETIALRSTSWGLGQVMGFNHSAAGYPSAKAMVMAFADDEENHLEAMVQFIITNDLDDEIRRHDWAGFARGYNGAGYKANHYDTKLAAAHKKWAKIKDTPWSPDAPEPANTADAVPVEALPTLPSDALMPKPAPEPPMLPVPPREPPQTLLERLARVFGA